MDDRELADRLDRIDQMIAYLISKLAPLPEVKKQ